MLVQLHIENVAVIQKADLDLTSGLNVLTGETGAGKSILIDSINLVLGERVSRDIVRTGASSAQVAALFAGISQSARKQVTDLGYACEEDGSLLISREISADGRGSCRIGGRPATASIVRTVGRLLVNIHGQHENQALMSPEKHLRYLDLFASTEQQLSAYREPYQEYKRLEHALSHVELDESAKARRIDLLKYQINEIRSAALVRGEEEELLNRKAHVQNAEHIAQALSDSYVSLDGGEDGGPGAQELLAEAAEALGGITEYCPELTELANRLSSLSLELQDCVSELRGYEGDSDEGNDDIDSIEQRLDTIYRLKMKYGGSVGAVLDFLKKSEQELEEIETSDETARKIRSQMGQAHKKALAAAGMLTKKRTDAAASMEKRIAAELADLEMPGVRFSVRIDALPALGTNGADDVEFLISANPGSPLRPLARIASGGEISRIMLTIKTVLAGCDDIDTLIFDEIDTGVSGRAAQKIGMKLRQVAVQRQVLCVTHLAQIASQADRHVLIEKSVKNGQTYTHLQVLDDTGRQKELARIIGGAEITPLTLANAAEMLRLNRINAN